MKSAAAGLAATLLALALTACGAGSTESPSPSASTEKLLAENGVAGLSGKQVVEKLDATNDDRGGALMGSVTPAQVTLAVGGDEVALPLEEFYLAVAPYETQTHDCFNHNVTTCQGELAGKDIAVTITDDDGTVLVDDTVTTQPNGFAGFWLPKDITGTVEVRYAGRQASAPISTGAEDPTCLTTLKLT
ncbi:CueP family metal-binding protein [Kribbia dieselivorans]|uniref:CueP family metal-binding protein n=1 Tax=Kribbia dieselivorans TaxID=331526 RepID=UPI000839486C|nr:CueP family metal-binding protein [Kribbia dieselivorans]